MADRHRQHDAVVRHRARPAHPSRGHSSLPASPDARSPRSGPVVRPDQNRHREPQGIEARRSASATDNADQPFCTALLTRPGNERSAHIRRLRARVHHGPLSHQVIALAATGSSTLLPLGRSGWPSSQNGAPGVLRALHSGEGGQDRSRTAVVQSTSASGRGRTGKGQGRWRISPSRPACRWTSPAYLRRHG